MLTGTATFRSGPISMRFVDTPELAVGFAVSKHVGNAVVRNRIRRRIRSAIRELNWCSGAVLIGASKQAAQMDFSVLKDHLSSARESAEKQ